VNQELNQLPQINADMTRQRMEAAIKEVAIGVANTEKAGKVTVTFDIKPQKNTDGQVNIDARVSFAKPTMKGKRSEETTDSTPMFVSRDGVSAIKDQPSLNFDNDPKVTDLKAK